MTMPREVSDIERLIEDGLSRYGQGDLDGALLEWEQALAIDPENPQANSYVDYVRINYELLTAEVNSDADAAPFGIADDEGDYAIEIIEGLSPAGEPTQPVFMDPLDEGWIFEEEPMRVPQALRPSAGQRRAELPDPEPFTLELEADEPPDPEPFTLELEADEPPAMTVEGGEGGVSFDDATREYDAPRSDVETGRNEFEPPEPTLGFGAPMDTQTPHQFAQQTTALRERSLGFVKATGVVETLAPPTAPFAAARPVAGDPAPRQKRSSMVPPELQMTLRTPGEAASPDASAAPDPDDEPTSSVEPLADLALTLAAEPVRAAREALDLVACLPSPRPAPTVPNLVGLSMATRPAPAAEARRDAADVDDDNDTVDRGVGADTGDITGDHLGDDDLGDDDELDRPDADAVPGRAGDTLEFLLGPSGGRAPAPVLVIEPLAPLPPPDPLDPLDAPPSPTAPTRRELSLESLQLALRTDEINVGTSPTLDFELRTSKIEPVLPARSTGDPVRDAPTARIPKLQRPPAGDHAATTPGHAPDPFVGAPTRNLGLRPPRASTEDEPTAQTDIRTLRAARGGDAMPVVSSPRPDHALPLDAMDARAAQILADLDGSAPPDETPGERTKRRITGLFERATAWSRTGELDQAVAAVELALSEDASSAVAQKLIQRYRETVQSVFQSFLGDLERQPVLARPLHELAKAPISPRAAFLLSRVDGAITLDEILDVSGMPRLEAFRYLCQLYLRGILR